MTAPIIPSMRPATSMSCDCRKHLEASTSVATPLTRQLAMSVRLISQGGSGLGEDEPRSPRGTTGPFRGPDAHYHAGMILRSAAFYVWQQEPLAIFSCECGRRLSTLSSFPSGGRSMAMLDAKKPFGFSVKPAYSTGMIGKSSGLQTWVWPKECQSTTSAFSISRFCLT